MKDEISLGELIFEVLKFLKKYKLLIGIFFIVGGALGFVQEQRSLISYTSNMVICSDLIKHNRIEEFIKDVGRAASQGNSTYLAMALNLTEDQAKEIIKIDIADYNSSNSYGTRAKILENHFEECVDISITVLDKSFFGQIELGISNLINSNPVVNNILVSKKENIERSRQMVIEDVKFLREQRKDFIKSLGDRKNASDVDQFVTESNLIYAYDKITEYSELLDRMVPSYVMKSFSDVSPNPKSSLKKAIMFGAFLTFIGIGIGVFREIKI